MRILLNSCTSRVWLRFFPVIGIIFAFFSFDLHADEGYFSEISGQVKFESRWYSEAGTHPGQNDQFASGFVIEPLFYIENEKGWSFNLAPFYHSDSLDSERTHADVREAYFLLFGDVQDSEWEIRLGIDHVFWGASELTPLVDIINQWDAVEDPFGQVKLGQQMAHFTMLGNWGIAELFFLPNHRIRTFPGIKGRLRPCQPIDNLLAVYVHNKGKNHDDFALRYSHTIGSADVGFSIFEGTSREPRILTTVDADGQPVVDEFGCPTVLFPAYEQIRQLGLDVGMPVNNFIFKLEAISRVTEASEIRPTEETYWAYLLGGEYTHYSLFDTDAELTIFIENIRDERGTQATSAFQNDLFLAGRVSLNDVDGTAVTVSLIKDLDYESNTLGFEFSRRLTDDWALEIEAVKFIDADPRDQALYPTRRDGYVDLSLTFGF